MRATPAKTTRKTKRKTNKIAMRSLHSGRIVLLAPFAQMFVGEQSAITAIDFLGRHIRAIRVEIVRLRKRRSFFESKTEI